MPSYVDSESDAYDRSLGEFKIGSNEIPTQKARYAMNRKILRERMIAVQEFGNAALNSNTRDALLDVLFDSTDKLLQANVNARTHQRMQICSTGKLLLHQKIILEVFKVLHLTSTFLRPTKRN